jgi:hypothetical protein
MGHGVLHSRNVCGFDELPKLCDFGGMATTWLGPKNVVFLLKHPFMCEVEWVEKHAHFMWSRNTTWKTLFPKVRAIEAFLLLISSRTINATFLPFSKCYRGIASQVWGYDRSAVAVWLAWTHTLLSSNRNHTYFKRRVRDIKSYPRIHQEWQGSWYTQNIRLLSFPSNIQCGVNRGDSAWPWFGVTLNWNIVVFPYLGCL